MVIAVWRNRETRILILSMGLMGLAAAGVAALVFPQCALYTLVISAAFTACGLLFTAWRYREIARLSAYIRRISGGDYSLDLRDNREGELSVLKDDIYKVTLKLSEQASLLQREKTRLTDAIADISHQLKTPLTSVTVMADLLRDARLSEEKRTVFARNISTQLERIEWLVSSLLKLSRIDAGAVRFKKDEIAAKSLLLKALEPVLIPMDIKEQTLSCQGEDRVFFHADLRWTAEALTNILKNCVEHTPQGGRIRVSFEENPLFIQICVSDNGRGIARQDIPHIFKRFYKGKNSGEDSVGIGLNLAHSIITAQNGDVSVESTQGAGTRFTIKFYKQII